VVLACCSRTAREVTSRLPKADASSAMAQYRPQQDGPRRSGTEFDENAVASAFHNAAMMH